MFGIIGGSGLYEIEGITLKEAKKILTPFGETSDFYKIGELSQQEIVFLPRHGLKHTIPPHKINYRANIWGFKELGVKRIISISAVGGISPNLKPGTIVVPDQIIDMTSNRDATFYDDEVVHIDFTNPYCPELRKSIIKASKKRGVDIKRSGTYICVNGPRLETRAEIKYFSRIGADIVGMTAMPEAALARETEICFGGISVVTNHAAGMTEKKMKAKDVVEVMRATTIKLKELLKDIFYTIPFERKCSCKNTLNEASV